MRVVAKRPWIIGVMPWGYWRAELIDKSGNIRGKPAEKILKEAEEIARLRLEESMHKET